MKGSRFSVTIWWGRHGGHRGVMIIPAVGFMDAPTIMIRLAICVYSNSKIILVFWLYVFIAIRALLLLKEEAFVLLSPI